MDRGSGMEASADRTAERPVPNPRQDPPGGCRRTGPRTARRPSPRRLSLDSLQLGPASIPAHHHLVARGSTGSSPGVGRMMRTPPSGRAQDSSSEGAGRGPRRPRTGMHTGFRAGSRSSPAYRPRSGEPLAQGRLGQPPEVVLDHACPVPTDALDLVEFGDGGLHDPRQGVEALHEPLDHRRGQARDT
jgi:hypothetical protein